MGCIKACSGFGRYGRINVHQEHLGGVEEHVYHAGIEYIDLHF